MINLLSVKVAGSGEGGPVTATWMRGTRLRVAASSVEQGLEQRCTSSRNTATSPATSNSPMDGDVSRETP